MTISKPKLGIFGCFQNGKSTLVNCLLDGLWAATGSGEATTKLNMWFRYGLADTAEVRRCHRDTISLKGRHQLRDSKYMKSLKLDPSVDEIHAETWRPLVQKIDLLDTPGVNHDKGDNSTALAGLDQVDAAVILLTNGRQMAKPELALLNACRKRATPVEVIVNCKDSELDRDDPSAEDNQPIYEAIRAGLKISGHCLLGSGGANQLQRGIWPCNLLWATEALGHLEELLREGGDAGLDAASKKGRIERHFRVEKEMPVPDAGTLFELSGLRQIREMFENHLWRKASSTERNRGDEISTAWQGAMMDVVHSWKN